MGRGSAKWPHFHFNYFLKGPLSKDTHWGVWISTHEWGEHKFSQIHTPGNHLPKVLFCRWSCHRWSSCWLISSTICSAGCFPVCLAHDLWKRTNSDDRSYHARGTSNTLEAFCIEDGPHWPFSTPIQFAKLHVASHFKVWCFGDISIQINHHMN